MNHLMFFMLNDSQIKAIFEEKNDLTHPQADILTLRVSGSLLPSEEYLVFSALTESLENEEQKLL